MIRIATLLAFVPFLIVESKFYLGEIAPYGYGARSYGISEYDPEIGSPYGLSYKKYPNIPYEYGAPKVIEYERPILGPDGPIGLKYGRSMEYPNKLGYGGFSGGYGGHPVGITKGIGYGYGPVGPYSPLTTRGLGPIAPHGLLDFDGHHGPHGFSQIDKGIYSDGKQNIIGEQYNQIQGLNGESINHGDVGFNKGEVAYKDIKGDSVHFIDSDGLNRGQHEGKFYHGGENFNNEGKQGNERFLNGNHNKGHNVKGFKKSHHLDETGKTEEFFDQDHDNGGNYAYEGEFGKYGRAGGNAYKGGFNDGRFKTGETTKQGHLGNEYYLDKAQAGEGKFGGNKYANNNEAYGFNKGFGEHDLTGHHENSNIFKKYPVGYGGYY